MLSTVLPVALLAVGMTQAVNTPPPAPLNSQLGKLSFPVTCKLLNFLNQTFDTVFTATAPVYGGSGHEVYYTDVTGLIDIPGYITGLAPIVNASQASADITVELALTNASPSTLVAFKNTINNITFPAGKDAFIRVPQGNGTLPPIGPVTLGEPNVAHRIFLGSVDVAVTLLNAGGEKVLGPLDVTCGQQPIDYIIGSVNVDSFTEGVQEPSVGYVPSFQPTPFETESGYYRFPYDCSFGQFGNQSLDLIIGGTIPTYVSPGQQLYLNNTDGFLRVPDSIISDVVAAYPSVDTFQTNITYFELRYSNANPGSLNVAATPLLSTIPVSSGDDLFIPVPSDGTLVVGPVTVSTTASIVSLTVGTADAVVDLLDSDGIGLYSFAVSCNVPAPLELISVPITATSPENYALGFPQTASTL